MSRIKIMCTSTGCIEYAPERYRDLGIDIIRVHIFFEGNEYLEGIGLDPVEFYEKLEKLEKAILSLGENPYLGIKPKYSVLRRQGFLVLITEKDLIFYKVNEQDKKVTVYAVVDQRQDYLSIIRGL